MMRPIARPPPAMAPHTPKARARSRASVKVTVSSERAAGAIRAAKAPCRARAAKSRLASRCQAAEGGRPGEAEQPHQQDPLASHVVGDAAAEEQQAAEGERVGRDHPLPVGGADVQGVLGARAGRC